MDETYTQSEFKVVTYVDLVTQVAGVPSFLLIISKFLLKHFENFYSDLQMASEFKANDQFKNDEFGFWRQF